MTRGEEEQGKGSLFVFFTDGEFDVVIEVAEVEAEPLVDLVQVAGEPLVRNVELDFLRRLPVVLRGVVRLIDVRCEAHPQVLVDLEGPLGYKTMFLNGKSCIFLLSRFSAGNTSRATMAFNI